MYGVVTRNGSELDLPEFDRGFYEVKDVTGRATEPVPNAANAVSCFGDTAAVEADPDLAPVDDEGRPATRDRPYFDWAYVDPTHEGYRDRLLDLVAECGAVAPDVRLDDVGFPRDEYCHCDRCDAAFAASPHEDRAAWRASVLTEFVAAAADRVPGRTSLALHPDPYPGHLFERSGLDLEALTPHVDEFVVPLYDVEYGTTYWLESLARGFRSRLATLAAEFSVELYAVDVDVDALVHAAEVAEAYAANVYFGYDASRAAAAVRRKRADARGGVTHRPEPDVESGSGVESDSGSESDPDE
jgi:hypothetical protein